MSTPSDAGVPADLPVGPATDRSPALVPLTRLTRRRFLALAAASGAAALLPALPGCGAQVDEAAGFFTAAERRLLAALADVVLPPDGAEPGASAMGAVGYIERLLTAFDVTPPALHAGGPFSGRRPGATQNDFARFLPLSRVSEAGWRLRLYGSAGVSGGGPNDKVLGPVLGLRERVKQTLAMALAQNPDNDPEHSGDPARFAALWESLPKDTRDAVAELILEGCFAAPEYGGNRGGAGWALARFAGDSLPQGYSTFDEAAGAYRERDDAPVSRVDPGAPTDPIDDETAQRLKLIALALGGRAR